MEIYGSVVYEAAKLGGPMRAAKEIVLARQQLENTGRAGKTGMPLMLQEGDLIEPRNGQWVGAGQDESVLLDAD